MKDEKGKGNGFLDMLASILVVFVVLAVFWYLISEWIDLVKNPQTRTVTIVTTIVTIILMVLIYNNPEFVQSLLKE
jgi:Kef-type K+ transport system membrane component KefB